MIENSDQFD